MHAYALESLSNYLKPGMCALDIGSGSGYLTACMAAMVGTSGKAVGIEHIAELVDKSREALEQHYPEWVRSGCIKFVTGDGRQGYADDSPYDCIHVGAASPKTPTELLRQLKSPGRMFVPVGTTDQRIKVFDKDAHGNVAETDMMGVVYVPLTDETLQRNS
ncbi:hypothetical protein EC988_007329 [Linderina pennispora]|nr:hypothetical protein EC988_007329 [Linderina pennispora]